LFTRMLFLCVLLYGAFLALKNTVRYATEENIKAAKNLYHDVIHYIDFYPTMFTNVSLYFFFAFLVTIWFARLIFITVYSSIIRVDPDNEFEYHPQIKYLL
jgi:hypothetical protein